MDDVMSCLRPESIGVGVDWGGGLSGTVHLFLKKMMPAPPSSSF